MLEREHGALQQPHHHRVALVLADRHLQAGPGGRASEAAEAAQAAKVTPLPPVTYQPRVGSDNSLNLFISDQTFHAHILKMSDFDIFFQYQNSTVHGDPSDCEGISLPLV